MILGKHCPYCRHLVHMEEGDKTGKCDRCLNDYVIKYHLSRIRLTKVFVPRNYETEILAFIKKRTKTYAGEISCNVGMSKGLVSTTLRRLQDKRLIIVTPRGKTKWITLPVE